MSSQSDPSDVDRLPVGVRSDVNAAERSPGESADEPAEEVLIGEVYDILRNERRRLVLSYLADSDGHVTMGELADRLAAIENDKPESQISSQERKRLYVGLYQWHLPRMDDAGALAFDGDRGTVEATEHTSWFVEQLPENRAAPQTEDRWPLYYLAVAAPGVAVLLVDLAGAMPLGTGSVIGVLVAVTCLCAVAHALADGRTSLDPA